MGFLRRSSTVVSPARVRGDISRSAGYGDDFWYLPEGWTTSLAMAGIGMTPELAMTLSYVYSAVDIISADFGTCPCSLYRSLENDARVKVRFSDPGIGGLYYRLRWQPNAWQSAKAFWSTLAWQYLLRPAAYAEIVYRPGSDSIVDQLVPRHPDRVEEIRLSSGGIAFKLAEPNGPPRFVTQAEMLAVRNTSSDGLNAISRIEYGAKALSTGLTLQEFTRTFFKKGITGSLLATYKGSDMDEQEELALHKSITRYVQGAEHAGGVMLVPEDIDVKALGVDPEKAQLLGLKDLSGRDVARLFKMPPHKLAIAQTQTYGSQVQSAQEYVIMTQMPIVREFQDAIYIHLIVARDYYAKFNTGHLTQATAKERMEAHEVAIRARVYRPSEARVMEDMSPDAELDRLSALDHRAGSQRDGQDGGRGNSAPPPPDPSETEALVLGRTGNARLVIALHDNAQRLLARERSAVEKLAKRYASAQDVPKWRDGLRTFYEDFAPYVAETMRVPIDVARAYVSQHGQSLQDSGIGIMNEHWARVESVSLVELALEPESIDRLIRQA